MQTVFARLYTALSLRPNARALRAASMHAYRMQRGYFLARGKAATLLRLCDLDVLSLSFSFSLSLFFALPDFRDVLCSSSSGS